MRRCRNLLFLLLTVAVLVSCKPQVPGKYIQPDDMEDILYDYTLADGMGMTSGVTTADVLGYRIAVLKKHGVTEAEFDSSLVYYTRHADRLHKMYENISRRLENEASSQGATLAFDSSTDLKGDTASVWNGPSSLVLIPNQPYNMYQFRVKSDSSYHAGDHIMLRFDTQFIFQDGVRDGVAVLAVTFGNDSTAEQSCHITMSNHFQLEIDDSNRKGIKDIRGCFVLLRQNSSNSSLTTLKLMSVQNISLIRMHVKEAPPAPKADADSSKVVRQPADTARRMTVDSSRMAEPPHRLLPGQKIPASAIRRQ